MMGWWKHALMCSLCTDTRQCTRARGITACCKDPSYFDGPPKQCLNLFFLQHQDISAAGPEASF